MTAFEAFLIVPAVLTVIGYLCGIVKLGFMVAEWTKNTGFDMGFYMMTVSGALAAPIATAAYFASNA